MLQHEQSHVPALPAFIYTGSGPSPLPGMALVDLVKLLFIFILLKAERLSVDPPGDASLSLANREAIC